MRERVSTKIASDWKKCNVKKICMLATESLLVDFCSDFNYMIQDQKHNSELLEELWFDSLLI